MNVPSPKTPAPAALRRAGNPAAVIAKTGVCVALVAALAWIAASSDGGNAAAPTVAEAPPPVAMTITPDRAAAHRRQLFDERRVRFSARDHTQVAGNELPLVQAP